MNELIEIIISLTEDNRVISDFIDKNMDHIKNNEIDEINNGLNDFHLFLNKYKIKNDRFKILMKENNLSSIWAINEDKNIQIDNKESILKKFEVTVKEAQTKINLYSKLISSELNIINKIKCFKSSGNLDFKI